jgi:hypothetical protein
MRQQMETVEDLRRLLNLREQEIEILKGMLHKRGVTAPAPTESKPFPNIRIEPAKPDEDGYKYVGCVEIHGLPHKVPEQELRLLRKAVFTYVRDRNCWRGPSAKLPSEFACAAVVAEQRKLGSAR